MTLALSFAAPLAFWGLLLVLPIVGLYLLKVQRRRVTVAYLRLWESLVVETRARSLFQRMKRWASLLLQLGILLAILLAVSDPTFELDGEEEHIVVLLDCSASMNAQEAGGKKRFELMLAAARKLVDERSFEDSMMLVAVSDRIDVLSPFTRNPVRLRKALDRARPSQRALDAERAVAFAREVGEDKKGAGIVFVSDGAAGTVQAALKRAEGSKELASARLVAVGKQAENVGIVRFSARKNTSLGTDYVLAVVKNFGLEPRECRLELRLNGVTQKVLPKTLRGGEEITERFQLSLPEGGTLELDVGSRDALEVDDLAYAIVRPSRLRRVVLVAARAAQIPAFRIAFGAMGQVIDPGSMAVTVEEYAQLSADERRADVTICMGAIPAALPKLGNLILIDTPLPESLPAMLTGAVEKQPKVWDWDREHLLNRYLNYKDLPLPPARVMELREGGVPLVQSYEGPLVAAFDLDARRAVYVAFDMTSKMFPFRLAFPMLLRNAIAWFELEEDVLLQDTYRPGEVIVPLRRVAGTSVQASYFREGARVENALPVASGRFHFAATDEPGPYLFSIAGAEHATAVNLFDPEESAIAPAVAEGSAEASGDTTKGGVFDRDPWPLLVFLALVLWTLEWLTYHRRVTE